LILFCDSSALVKLYLQEQGSDAIKSHASASEILAVCRIAWVEIMSALARRQRERPQDAAAIAAARQHFETDWPNYLCLELTQELATLAGDYADTFALRAYDSVQLAAAELARREITGEFMFACFDARLLKAARVLGMQAA
jgi:predicted nucleic acid-binding protein